MSAKKLKEEQVLDDANQVESVREQDIVQMNLTDKEAAALGKKYKDLRIEPNLMVNACTDGENVGTEEKVQWYRDALNIPVGTVGGDRTVRVEILDSGVSYILSLEEVCHVDLTEDGDGGDGMSLLYDDVSGHGTALAGIIGADGVDGEIHGINPDAKLYSVRIMDENLQAPVSRVIQGIYWGIENHVDIINMSFGMSTDSEALHEAVRAAEDAGILLIAAAGNDADSSILYPAAYPEVMAVGATNANGSLSENSSRGDQLEVAAPGTQIITSAPFDTYVSGGGTSLSAAEVTGVASCLLSMEGATADMVRQLLSATGRQIGEDTDAVLADFGKALADYEDFRAQYTGGSLTDEAFVNTEEPEVYDTDGIVNGLWNTNTHAFLVNQANDQTPKSTELLSNMVYAARAADDSEFHDDKQTYGALHGLGRYGVNLMAVWKYANLMNRGDSAAQAHSEVMNNYLSHEQITTSTNGNTTEGLMDACDMLINQKATSSQKSTNAKKKYLIVGFGMHLIGDTYAHRTIVPEYVVKNAQDGTYNSEKNKGKYASGNSSDFKSYLCRGDFKWNDEKEHKGLEDAWKNGTEITFPKLDDYKNTSLYNEKTETKFNTLYEDNQDFCRERLNAAVKCCKAFLKQISESGNVPDATIIQEQTNVKLIHYEANMKLCE